MRQTSPRKNEHWNISDELELESPRVIPIRKKGSSSKFLKKNSSKVLNTITKGMKNVLRFFPWQKKRTSRTSRSDPP